MKRLSFLFSIGSLAVVSLLSSCKKDDEVKPAPTVTTAFVGASGSNMSAPFGTPIKINYTASAAEGIDVINISTSYDAVSNGAITGYPKKSGFKTSTSDDATVDYVSPSSSVVTITITVTDKKGVVATSTLTLNKSVALTESTGGIYYNFFGTGLSAYDFDSKANVTGSSTAAEIVSSEATANVVTFTGRFKGVNGAMILKSTAATYTSATTASLTAEFTAGTPVAEATPMIGDVFIIKSGAGMYAVIKITAITNDGAGTSTTPKNQDNVTFVFKK